MPRSRKSRNQKKVVTAAKKTTHVVSSASVEGGFVLPSPPVVQAYGTNYAGYLVDYQKYREAVSEIRSKKLTTDKKSTIGVSPASSNRVVQTRIGPVEIVGTKVWVTRPNANEDGDLPPVGLPVSLRLEEHEITGAPTIKYRRVHESGDTGATGLSVTEVLEEAESAWGVKIPISQPADVNLPNAFEIPAATKSGPVPVRPVAKKPSGKRRKIQSQRALNRELKAVKLAADLATSLSKGEKMAARAGRSIVKTKDGWNLVVKGQGKQPASPKPKGAEVVGYSDSLASALVKFRLVNNDAEFFQRISRVSPACLVRLNALGEFELGKVVSLLREHSIPVAIFAS